MANFGEVGCPCVNGICNSSWVEAACCVDGDFPQGPHLKFDLGYAERVRFTCDPRSATV